MGGKGGGGGSAPKIGHRAREREDLGRTYTAYLLSNPDVKAHPYYGRNPGTAREHWNRHGRSEGRTYDARLLPPRGAPRQVGSGEGTVRGGGTPSFTQMSRGGIPNLNRDMMAKATGAAAGAALGNFLLGPFGTGQGARLGYRSAQEGYIGDAFNTRRGEGYRDFLEDKGVSRKDVKLAGRHPGTLERAAKSRGYSGDASGSILSEGEDYDSITGEIF